MYYKFVQKIVGKLRVNIYFINEKIKLEFYLLFNKVTRGNSNIFDRYFPIID